MQNHKTARFQNLTNKNIYNKQNILFLNIALINSLCLLIYIVFNCHSSYFNQIQVSNVVIHLKAKNPYRTNIDSTVK